jgi:hypothetical protein
VAFQVWQVVGWSAHVLLLQIFPKAQQVAPHWKPLLHAHLVWALQASATSLQVEAVQQAWPYSPQLA